MSAKRLCKIVNGIAQAREWANELVRREARGPGDIENAMRRLEGRYGIDWRMFWRLRYRPPGDVFVSTFLQLKHAYDAECERQESLLRHDREIAEAKISALEAAIGPAADPPGN